MFQGEYSAILSTFIKLPFVIKIFILSIFKWPFYTGFTVGKISVFLAFPGHINFFWKNRRKRGPNFASKARIDFTS